MSVPEFLKQLKASKQRKANRNFSLDVARFDKFRAWCKEHELSASEVVDALIAWFLEEVK